MVGFNQWDEEWEVGGIDLATGEDDKNTNRIRSKEYISIFGNTNYYFKNQNIGILFFYDSNKNFISTIEKSNAEFLTPSDAAYMRFRMAVSYGTTYNHDICINISDPSKNGTYEPYKKSKLNLNLNSFKVKDSQGNIVTISGGLKSAGSVYDEIVGNKYIKRVGSVNMSECPIGNTTPGVRCVFKPGGMKAWISRTPYTDGVILNTTKYKPNTNDENYNCWIGGLTSGDIAVYDSAFTDEAAIRQVMSGIVAYYELATPIEYEIITPTNFDYSVDRLGTERVISNTVPTPPFRADITYYEANIKDVEIEGITEYLKRSELSD